MIVSDQNFHLIQNNKPVCLVGIYRFQDGVFTNKNAPNIKVKVRCTSTWGNMSSFEKIKN
ncbi:hypothetical protein [Flavobacterium gawalongense]|uniref:Uncharacterized protein n=1 Tax=Flavobacterium gawalongense TaxID=2594432 RepID=A0A553BQN6_9FLAO|nr:hypothetical protein [Flavobacterium gawalongense]TRX10558.1 hypothetical protein FNW11_07495 [Flavobacterium gawalongense]TRX11690.1 hypothetical protein FNW10_06095 [Flavobacterium gawalongense]TRX29482.1 hypothetical protein FNW38_06190 [Flavobacterium gawalongense]